MGIGSAALVELAPVVDGLGELAVLMAVEARGVDVIFFVPFFVLADETFDQHFVALAEGLAADVVGVGTGQVVLAGHQVVISDNAVVFLGRVALVTVVELCTFVAEGMLLADTKVLG